jgi:protease-4
MGSVAASGGYYVAMGADAIIANRSTITGSIGVFGGKFAIADGLREFGVNPDEVRVGGEFASAYSTEKLTNLQRSKLHDSLEATYVRFTGLVAEGRKLPIERVREIAKGRVWSGEDAQKIGLVDQTGDLIVAIDKAKELAGFKPDDRATIRLKIQEGSPFELLTKAMTKSQMSADELRLVSALAPLVGDKRAQAVLSQIRQLTAKPGVQVWQPPIIER